MSRPAPTREAMLQYIRESGTTGRRFSDIQRFYAKHLGWIHFDPHQNRGLGCLWLCNFGNRRGLLSRYCTKVNKRWVLNEFITKIPADPQTEFTEKLDTPKPAVKPNQWVHLDNNLRISIVTWPSKSWIM